jgi:hypothetical protein
VWRRLRVDTLTSGIKAAGVQDRLLGGTGEPTCGTGWDGLARSSDEIFRNEERAKGLRQLVLNIYTT